MRSSGFWKFGRINLPGRRSRISETATRVRIGFAAACPEADLFSSLVRSFQPAGP